MQIGHASPPPAAAGHRADNATARAMNAIATGLAADAAEDGESVGPAVSGAATAKAAPTAPLSQSNLGAAIGAQSDAGDESGAVIAPGRSGETPAARARALIAENPDLADRPFGHIVSALARGLEVDLDTPDPAGTDGEEGASAVAAVTDDEEGEEGGAAVTPVTDDEAGEETSGAVGETTDGPAGSDAGPSAGADDGSVDVASTGDGGATVESGAVAPEDAGILPLPDANLTVAENLEDQLLDLLDGDDEEIV